MLSATKSWNVTLAGSRNCTVARFAMSKEPPQFVFMTCRAGAEGCAQAGGGAREPEWRLSFSRPGFLTFKHTGERPLDDRQLAERNWTFAHAHGISLGKLTGDSLSQLVEQLWQHDGVADLASTRCDRRHSRLAARAGGAAMTSRHRMRSSRRWPRRSSGRAGRRRRPSVRELQRVPPDIAGRRRATVSCSMSSSSSRASGGSVITAR